MTGTHNEKKPLAATRASSDMADAGSAKDNTRAKILAISMLAFIGASITAGLYCRGLFVTKWSGPAPTVQAPGQPPEWAAGFDPAQVAGWSRIQQRFKFPQSALHSAIQVLSANERYEPAHPLHNLNRYPREVERAFLLLTRSGATRTDALRQLRDELGSRVVGSKSLIDHDPEAPISGYEPIQNLTVFACIEYFYDHREDAGVKEVLWALRHE